MMPENLFVVRHGESIGNLAKRRSKQGDHSLIERLRGTHTAHWPLTEKGCYQAIKTGDFINQNFFHDRKIIFDRMYFSSYARAMQTAAHLNLIHSKWIVDTRIVERDWGSLDRMTEEERLEKFGEAMAMREVEPFFWAPPGGESMNDVTIRAYSFLDELCRENINNAIVVSHGEFAKILRMIFFGYTPSEYAEMEFTKDHKKMIHNCQIGHYSRRDPDSLELSDRLEWFRYYRPSEAGPSDEIYSHWEHIKRRRFDSHELLQMANKLSAQFQDIDLK